MNAELLEQIEAYLDGDLGQEELRRSALAAGVTNLESEIQWMRDARTAVEARELRSHLSEVLPAADPAPVRLRAVRRSWIAVAASVLILVATGLWWSSRPAVPALYAEYEYIDPGLPVLMSQSEDYELYDALTYYGEGNYAVAAEKLRQLRGTALDGDTLRYYLGASLLYRGDPAAAQAEFDRILSGMDSTFIPRAQWLAVLTALRSEDFAAARRRLDPILSTSGHPFAAAARSLAETWE